MSLSEDFLFEEQQDKINKLEESNKELLEAIKEFYKTEVCEDCENDQDWCPLENCACLTFKKLIQKYDPEGI
jgi:hypothetical protein